MGEYLEQVPEKIQDHLKQITKTSGLEYSDESIELIAQAWLEKKRQFEEETQKADMEDIDELLKDDERGALMMTYSGSLLTIGPLLEEGRHVEYVSIGLRKDVPDSSEKDASVLAEDINVDGEAVFDVGPISKSSPIFKIAVFKEELEAEEEEEKLSEATQILTEGFVDVNKTIILD